MPSIAERKIHLGEYFALVGNSPRDIRQEMCSYQCHFSSTGRKEVPSGNRTKRIIICIPTVNSEKFWDRVIYGESLDILQPTDDERILNTRVSRLLKKPLAEPDEYKSPSSIERLQKVYVRDPAVKAWILQQSKGIGENCGEKAPFFLK